MFKNILLPTDGSPLSREAVLAGVELAAHIGAKVTVLCVVPPATPILYKNLKLLGYGTTKHNEQALHKAAQQHLDDVAKAAKAAGITSTAVMMTSDFPADAVLVAAKKHKCDLVIMSSHSRKKSLSRMLLGSQTQKVLAQAEIPVMVYRS